MSLFFDISLILYIANFSKISLYALEILFSFADKKAFLNKDS